MTGTTTAALTSATVTYTDVPGSIVTTKTANQTAVPETGGLVNFTVRVGNTSAVDAVTIDTLADDVFGNLDGVGTCDVPQTIPAGGFYQCAFDKIVGGAYPGSHTDIVTASGADEEGIPVTSSDDATVSYTDVVGSIVTAKTANPTAVPETGGLAQSSRSVSTIPRLWTQ